eukprot:6313006-Pyramimonas_sp.AAC.1
MPEVCGATAVQAMHARVARLRWRTAKSSRGTSWSQRVQCNVSALGRPREAGLLRTAGGSVSPAHVAGSGGRKSMKPVMEAPAAAANKICEELRRFVEVVRHDLNRPKCIRRL